MDRKILAVGILGAAGLLLFTRQADAQPVPGSAAAAGAPDGGDGSGGLFGFSLPGLDLNFGGNMPSQDTISQIATAIFHEEGSQPGDRNVRNNNPGNLRNWPGYPTDSGGFTIFPDAQTGWSKLYQDVRNHIAANPDQSLTDWFASYSPDSTGLSGAYGAVIASALGVSPETKLGALA